MHGLNEVFAFDSGEAIQLNGPDDLEYRDSLDCPDGLDGQDSLGKNGRLPPIMNLNQSELLYILTRLLY